MKTSFFIAAACLVTLSLFIGWAKFTRNNDDITIAVAETDDAYTYTASFSEAATGRVQDYINHSIRPNSLFRSSHDYFDVNTTLADQTNFYVKESPGELRIRINKHKNSTASYLRIKNMCNGISNVLKGK
ncbi:hypothetical protein [Mucilaginibacter xinganensis]|uniref:Uncharacterized protein n=1 Tax=Mucilaginibacter xinganensis TaxID=1234841 RepID=A0A223P0X2_9SPHI|nr:hypothetical protein [Mucilaginibacter xinganensis]ASU35491.1 hypothetical protein MuYL_3606 [Mucilaginibacter xinganensis]